MSKFFKVENLFWLNIFIVLLTFISVLMRYAFDTSLIWQQELIRIFHGIIFLSCSGLLLKTNKHVRVDIFYQRLSSKIQKKIDNIGFIFLVVPVATSILYFSYDFVVNSWKILESSPEYGGMFGFFIYKSFILIFAINLITWRLR